MQKPRLVYTDHAKARMKQRGITEDEVKYCLDRCEIHYKDPKGNAIYRASIPGGKEIKVVTAADKSDPIVIITVADLPSKEKS
ncbi:MAG: DUF4258 domain-containing protein [Chloroflexota bacterium]|nr:DUF4258 domain-containing protein [Chloroflexota bacterium]